MSSNLLRFNQQFDNHSIDGLIGVEAEKGYSELLGVEGKGLPNGFNVPSVASMEKTISGVNTTEVFQSFISQVNYNYLSTYFLTGSYRIDASTNFPLNNRVAKFPAVSASVLLSKLEFANNINGLDLFKIRGSFGITGDPEIGAGRYMGLFALNSQYNNNSAATPFQLSNPDLTWEENHQLNFGIDWEMFSRLTLNFDVYNNVTKNLIVLKAMPLSQGFESRYENSGQVNNKGFEVALSAVVVDNDDFKIIADANISKNNNKLSGIGAPITTTIGGVTQIYRDGAQLYTFYLPKWLGVDEQTGAPLWEKITKDNDGNIISREPTSNYSEALPQEVGSALPDYSGGVSLTVQYKNIKLFTNGAYQVGNYIYNSTRIYMDNDGHEPYYNNMLMKDDWSRWERPGDVATHPSMQNSSLSTETSSRFLEKGSFFKIRTVSLQYDLPKQVSKKMKLKDISVVLTANNLFTFTQFWGQDPEVTLTNESWSMPGVCDFKYPNNRQYIVSLNVKF